MKMETNKKEVGLSPEIKNGIIVLDEKISANFYKLVLVDGLIIVLVGLLAVWPLSLMFIFLGLLTVAICEFNILKIGGRLRALETTHN